MSKVIMFIAFLTLSLLPVSFVITQSSRDDEKSEYKVNFLTDPDEVHFNRRMLVGKTDADVTINADLNKGIWKSASRGTFRSNRSLEEWKRIGWTIIPIPQLGGMGHVYATWNDNFLYLAFRCEKQAGYHNIPPEPITSGRDNADIFNDDNVQIYLQPERGDRVYKVVVNANGALWDAATSSNGQFDSSWNGEGINATGNDTPGYYEVEVAIPFKVFGIDRPGIGDTWRVNFCRKERPSDEKTSWSMTKEFADPESFGVIEFGKEQASHTIQGRVIVQDKPKVLAGVFVQTPEGMLRTGKDGRFSFNTWSPGVVSIRVGAFEWETVDFHFEVCHEKVTLPDIEMVRRSDDLIHADMVVMAEDLYKTEPGFEYSPIHRRYQACPKGIAILDDGKILVTYTIFGIGERRGNMTVIDSSTDGGKTWKSEVVVSDGYRMAWGNFFHDPKGRLWMFTNPPVRVHRCDDPGQTPMQWSNRGLLDLDLDPSALGENAPITMSDGTYLYTLGRTEFRTEWFDAYASTDEGKSWYLRGSAWCPPELRQNGEPMVVERRDGSLWMLTRLDIDKRWIGESFSYDGGRTWTDVSPSKIKHTASRFHISRLKSGRLLLIKHSDDAIERTRRGREDLTAYLSDDDGETWPYKLLIQDAVCSYPDAAQDKDGRIYIPYDIGRHGKGAEIRMAKISEEDIINGRIISEDSRLGILISRTGPRPESSKEFSFEWDRPAASMPMP